MQFIDHFGSYGKGGFWVVIIKFDIRINNGGYAPLLQVSSNLLGCVYGFFGPPVAHDFIMPSVDGYHHLAWILVTQFV